jgi:nitrogen regulatory protein PII
MAHRVMQLLVAVINHAELIDDVLAGFVELGITGATVLESKGMGRVISQELPIFAGLSALNAQSRTANRTIFCVADEKKVAAAIAMIEETCGDLRTAGVGILFTLPVSRVIGLAAELED